MSSSSRAAKDGGRQQRLLDHLRVAPGTAADLAGRSTTWTGVDDEFGPLTEKQLKATAKGILADGVEELSEAQELLWATDTYAVLVVFQAMDAAGKDSTIEHVMSGVNPQGVQVVGFRQPSKEELYHTFLWRIARSVPERGRIGIFNRSHYEDVLAVKVHPEWLDSAKLPPGPRDDAPIGQRFGIAANGILPVRSPGLEPRPILNKERTVRRLTTAPIVWQLALPAPPAAKRGT